MNKQEALKKINELKEYINELNKQESGQWKPEEGDIYWTVTDFAIADNYIWENDDIDLGRLKTGNVFKTQEEAQKHALRLESMAVKYLPKQGTMNWIAELDEDGFLPKCREWINDKTDHEVYLLGRTFRTKADCEAWISKYTKAWEL